MPGLTRRELLVGASVVGGAGALSGASSYAGLSDVERFTGNSLRAGLLDLLVGWSHAGDTGASDGEVAVDLGTLSPGDAGSVRFTVDLPDGDDVENNPAYVWLRTFCPATTGRLASALTLRLRYADEFGSPTSEPIFAGTLCEIAGRYRNGLPLDPEGDPDATEPGCLDTPEYGSLFLRLDYALSPDYVGDEAAELGFEFAAVACRHADPAERPFDEVAPGGCDCGPDRHGVSYVAVYVCDPDVVGCDCVPLGKLELDSGLVENCGIGTPETLGDSYLAPGSYDLPVDDDCEDTGYDLVVTETVTKPGGNGDEVVALAFEVVGDDDTPDPTLCQVAIKGGSGVAYYGPGDVDGNATVGVLGAPELGAGGRGGPGGGSR